MEGWCKIKKAAAYADVSPRTIREWLKKGLKHSRVKGGTIFIKYGWIDEFLESFQILESEAGRVDRIVDEVMKELG